MSNTRDYILQTSRLNFACWQEGDFPLAWRLWGDPRVARFLGGPFTEQQVEARLHREIASMRKRGLQYWPMFLIEDGSLVGCAGLQPYGEQGALELGFHLRPEYWGRGLAQEAAQAVIAYAFDELKLESLLAGHDPENLASRRILQKLGFRFLREEIYPPTGLINPLYRLAPLEVAQSGVVPSKTP